MKSNRLTQFTTEKKCPNASATEIASTLLHAFEQFGFVRNADFAKRASVIAFTNAVVLAKRFPEETKELFEIVVSGQVERNAIDIAAAALVSAVPDNDTWVGKLRDGLAWHYSPVCAATPGDAVCQETLFGLAVGLEVAMSHGELAGLIFRRACQLGDENRFLAARLVNWARNGFRPHVAPFVEFVAGLYVKSPIERDIICQEIEEALACANLLPDPWQLTFWVEQAWARGRRFAGNRTDALRQLLTEAPEANRIFTLKLYSDLVLNAAGPDGRVDIERATLAYFAQQEEGRCAVEYCRGDQPRKLVRLAFDFAFWMGILSALPLPDKVLLQE